MAQGAVAANPPSIVMGKAKRPWPDIVWPTERGKMTASDVLAIRAGQGRDEGIDDWCKQVWAAFSENRGMVGSLLSEYGLV